MPVQTTIRPSVRNLVPKSIALTTKAKKLLNALGLTSAELSLLLTDDQEIQTLNAQYRQIDAPTDVLSFPLIDSPEIPEGYDGPLGDVVISLERAHAQHSTDDYHRERLGNQDSWSVTHEILFLLVHGVLHLLGFDHEDDTQSKRMREAERTFFAHICPPRTDTVSD